MNLRFKDAVIIYNGKDYKDIETNEGFPVIGSGGQFAFASDFLYDGEVILLGRKGTIDKPLYYVGKFWSVDTMYYAVPKNNFCGKFLYYCAINFPFLKYSTATALPSMTKRALERFSIPNINIEEQEAIAEYLDKKSAEIDEQIGLLEQEQKAYESLKRSLISEVVTRGLNKEVPLKDSGIDWIGEIPAHWEVKRFKELFNNYSTGFTPDSKDLSNFSDDDNKTWVTIADLTSRFITHSNLCLSQKALQKYLPIITPKDSLLFSFKLSIGKTAFAGKDLYTNEAIVSINPQNNVELKYYYYHLPDVCFNNATENIYGAKMLNQRLIANMLMLFPPIEEQEAIAEYLDKKSAEIDRNISLIGKKIETYKRLKQSLIDEVVSGKRKI